MLLPVLQTNNWLDNEFDELFNSCMMPRKNTTSPAINIKESEKEYNIELAAPGIKKEDCAVNINEEGCLSIKMEHKEDKKEEDNKSHYLRREFSFTSYEQKFTLPDDIQNDKIIAKVENGVLSITLPRKEAEKKVQRSISVA